jgi:hypothetical protein
MIKPLLAQTIKIKINIKVFEYFMELKPPTATDTLGCLLVLYYNVFVKKNQQPSTPVNGIN